MGFFSKLYERIFWKNHAVGDTPLDESPLNRMDGAIDGLDDRTLELNATKLDVTEAEKLVRDVDIRESDGVITITYYSGAVKRYDTNLEKVNLNHRWDEENQILYLIAADGTEQEVNLSALITENEFEDSGTVLFDVDNGVVRASIKKGAVTEDLLQPNFLADVRTETAKAEKHAEYAEDCGQRAEFYAKLSQSYAAGGSGIREGEEEDNAKNYSEQAAANAGRAEAQADAAAASAGSASDSADAAKASENNAKYSENQSWTNQNSAKNSASAAASASRDAKSSKEAADISAASAAESAATAGIKAAEAESYARGGTGKRPGEDTDNAGYYYEQTKRISQSISGIVPMGTISFDELENADNQKSGYMFNISDSFVSDERFADGGEIFYGAGSNVLYTADGKWDVLAASMVSGVKGNAETEYRQGFVNISPEDIGALPSGGTAVSSSKWKTARAINGMSVDGSANRFNYGTCNTAAATAEKTVACAGYAALAAGSEITVKFTVTNTAANPTLNVNGTGAKAVYYRGAAIGAGYLAKNRTYTFRYNGAQWELVGDIDTNTTYAAATASKNGLMSAADKTKLDGIAAGAQVNSITGVKGNAESAYRKGDVNLTAENVGALPISGGTVTGEVILAQGSMVVNAQGHAGKQEYVCLATIRIYATYINYPIEMEIGGRNWDRLARLSVVFEGVGTEDPNIYSFSTTDEMYTGVFIAKVSTSTWKIYVEKSQGWGSAAIVALHNTVLSGVEIIVHGDEGVEELPTGAIRAKTIAAKNAAAIQDSGDGRSVTIGYSKPGITSADYFAAWDGYELRGMHKNSVVLTIGAVRVTGDTLMGHLNASEDGVWILGGESTNWLTVYTRNVESNSNLYVKANNVIYMVAEKDITCVKKSSPSKCIPIYASAFNTSSSIRIKENIEEMTDEEAKKILEVKAVTFDYIEHVGGEKGMRGCIAEEVAKIIPFAVNVPEDYNQNAAVEENTSFPSIDYSRFVPYLIKMVQIQQTEISELKNRLNEVEEKAKKWST